tara:strand:- start:874 stop:1047 length:174 start_codon:yes stop_codon:yes gene_type:complete
MSGREGTEGEGDEKWARQKPKTFDDGRPGSKRETSVCKQDMMRNPGSKMPQWGGETR